MKRNELLNNISKEKILILDGAMGTMIQQYTLEEEDFRKGWFEEHSHPLKGNNDLLSLTRPEIIKKIHAQYYEAGADIVETNTFSGTSIAQSDYQLQDFAYDINYHGAKLAREVADEFTKKEPDKPRFVAGSIGPTNRTASISPDVNDPGYRNVTFDKLSLSYQEQIKGLIDGGSDILLIETVFDTLNAKAALFAIEKYNNKNSVNIPIMLSGTLTDASGRTLSGQTLEAFMTSVSHINLLSIGLNCSFGAEGLYPYIKKMSMITDIPISVFPNAGLPNQFGEYDQTSQQMQNLIKDFLENNLVNIIGGCCGTTPDHIRLISEIVNNYSIRKIN